MPDEETTTTTATTDAAATATDDAATDALGDAGKLALDRMKAERDQARADAKRAKSLEAELAKLREATATDSDKAIAAAKAEGAAEATNSANARIVRAEVRSLAAGKLADPMDAVQFLDLDDFKIDANGDVDVKAIAKAIDALLTDKPYLAAAGNRAPGVPVGARGDAGGEDMNSLLRRAAGRA